MKITTHQLRRIINEALTLDIDLGDVVLTGKFKNPTINGKSILKFKIEKLLPKNKQSKKTQEEKTIKAAK